MRILGVWILWLSVLPGVGFSVLWLGDPCAGLPRAAPPLWWLLRSGCSLGARERGDGPGIGPGVALAVIRKVLDEVLAISE